MWFSFIISSFETLYIYIRENQCFLDHWALWCPQCLRSKGLFQFSSYWLSQQLSTQWPLPLWMLLPLTLPHGFPSHFLSALPGCSSSRFSQPQCFFPLLFPPLSFAFPLISSHFILFFPESSHLCPYLSSVTCTVLLIPKSKPSARAFSLKTRPPTQTSPLCL